MQLSLNHKNPFLYFTDGLQQLEGLAHLRNH